MATIGGPVIPGVTDGLILYLDAANEDSYPGTGTVWRDLSKSNISGSLVNGPVYSGRGKGANFSFDGVNDEVNLGNIGFPNGTNNATIDIWISFPSMSVGKYFMSKGSAGDGIHTFIGFTGLGPSGGGSAYIRFQASNSTTTISSIEYGNLIFNRFYNFTFTFDGTQIIGYQNGSSPITRSLTGPLYYSTTPLYLGRDRYGSNAACNIQAFRIYNRALTASEILQNYNSLKSRFNL